MKAVTWHGRRDVRVDEVPDPKIVDPTDLIVHVISTGICGSDFNVSCGSCYMGGGTKFQRKADGKVLLKP